MNSEISHFRAAQVKGLTDIKFLEAPPKLWYDALEYEMLREVAFRYPDVWDLGYQGLANWAELYICHPWCPPKPTKPVPAPRRHRPVAKKPLLQDWYGNGLTVHRATSSTIEEPVDELGRIEWVEFKATQLMNYWPPFNPSEEVQFVFRFSLNASRRDIVAAWNRWFAEFRRTFPAPRRGPPENREVLRYELAVLRLDRTRMSVPDIAAALSRFDEVRAARLDKPELRKIRNRMNRRIAKSKATFLKSRF